MSTENPLSRFTSRSSSKTTVRVDERSVKEDAEQTSTPPLSRFRFGMVFAAICTSIFLSALEFTSVSTALPTITHDLDGQDFVWVASAYALASVALLPASGGFAELFGRRSTMLGFQALFALGSALCGSAQSMNWLIAARTIQGAGGGGILSLGSIIVSDLVPLSERGLYNSLLGLTWALASAIGPLIGGALANAGQWRWVFYLNLPISAVASLLVLVFLNLRKPTGSFMEKISRMDWIGNGLIVASSTSAIIGLTWGGVRYPWDSVNVLLPLILGLAGMGFFLFYEARYAKEPLVPFSILSNRTSISGYIQTFINPIIMIAVVYFMPVYYQACKDASPTLSGVYLLGLSIVMGPILIIAGLSVKASGMYRPQLWVGWAILVLAMGVFTLLKADSPVMRGVGFPAIMAIGSGILYTMTYFPVLAPLPVSENAHALAFFSFCRSFAGVWGVTIGTAVLQTELGKRLPEDFVARFPDGAAIAFAAIPVIGDLPEPLQTEVREAFAGSIDVIWKVMCGIAAMGLLASLFMRDIPLHSAVDEKWALEGPQTAPGDEEKV